MTAHSGGHFFEQAFRKETAPGRWPGAVLHMLFQAGSLEFNQAIKAFSVLKRLRRQLN